MRKIARWASMHPWTSRFLIIFLYLPLNLSGLVLGDLLFDLGIELTGGFLLATCLVVLATIAYYPSRNHYAPDPKFFVKRKTADFLLIISTACMICFTGNQLNVQQPFTLATPAMGGPATGIENVTTTSSSVHANKLVKKLSQKKQLRKKVSSFIKSMRKKYKNASDGERILLIFLAVLLIAITVVLLLGLVCAIGCGGAEAITYLLLILGIGAGVFLTALIFKRLSRRTPKKQEEKSPQVQTGQ